MFTRNPLANPEPLIKRVYAYVAYRLGDGPEAEDVTSAVFENAVRYLDTYDPSRGEPVTWVIGIARRCVAQALVGRREPSVELNEVPGADDVESETVARLALEAAVRALSARDRELIELRYGGDLSSRQIADLLGIKPNAVDVALHRALARLRMVLEADDEKAETLPLPNRAERTM